MPRPRTARSPLRQRRRGVWLRNSAYSLLDSFAVLLIDHDFSHQSAKVLGVVGQMVEICGVQEVGARRNTCTIENYIQGLAATQSDRIGGDVEVVSRLIAQQLRVEADQLHGNSNGSQSLIFGNIEVGNAQQGFLSLFKCD